MIGVMKHIRLLIMVGLCLNPITVISSEWINNIAVPGSEEVAEKSAFLAEGFSEVVISNPLLVIIPAVMAAGGLLFCGRDEICQMSKAKYQKLAQELKSSGETIEQQINDNKAPLGPKYVLMWALRPIFGGIPSYITHNKWHMAVAALLSLAGRLFGHPFIGAGLGGTTLTVGWFNQGFAKVQQDIEKLRKENEALHRKTQEQISGLSSDIASVSEKIDVAKKEINTEIQNLGDQVQNVGDQLNTKIDDISTKVENLNQDLKDVPEQLINLLDSVRAIDDKEGQRDQKIEELFARLAQANKDYLSAQENLGVLSKKCIEKLGELTASTTKQLSAIQLQSDNQEEKIDALLEKEAECNQILKRLSNGLEENNKQVVQLQNKIDANDKEMLLMLSQITKVHESNSLEFTKKISELNKEQNRMWTAFANFFSEMETKMDKIEGKVDKMEGNVSILTDQVSEVQISMNSLERKLDSNFDKQKKRVSKQKKESEELKVVVLGNQLTLSENIARLNRELAEAKEALMEEIIKTQKLVRENQLSVTISSDPNNFLSQIEAPPSSVPFIPLREQLKNGNDRNLRYISQKMLSASEANS